MKYLTEEKRIKLDTDIYAITGERFSLGRSNVEVVSALSDSGIKIIQYREKEKKARAKYQECLAIREIAARNGILFIINDDLDIAMAVGADGIHIGQDDLPPAEIRKIAGDKMIIGLSTHSPKQAREALDEGIADYIGVGPVFKTETKADVCNPVGYSYLEYVAKNIPLPFVAIGGIKEHNIHEVWKRGAGCVAMVTEIVGAENITDKVKAIRCHKSKIEKLGGEYFC